jgi:hypothetical protein
LCFCYVCAITYRSFAIVFVNNSTDETLRICKQSLTDDATLQLCLRYVRAITCVMQSTLPPVNGDNNNGGDGGSGSYSGFVAAADARMTSPFVIFVQEETKRRRVA